MADEIRAFIGLEINAGIRNELTRIQNELKTRINSGISWVKPDNIHITLRFLGNIKPEAIASLTQIIENICQKTKRFEINLGALGVFASFTRPRVIWVSIDNGLEQLKIIHQHLTEQLKTIGLEPEAQIFHSHLTLGRVKFLKNNQLLKDAFQNITCDNSLLSLTDKLILFQSRLSPQGAIYRRIAESNFLSG